MTNRVIAALIWTIGLTTIIWCAVPAALADNQEAISRAQGYTLEGFSWGCGHQVTYSASESLREAAEVVMNEIRDDSGLNLVETAGPADINIEMRTLHVHSSLGRVVGLTSTPQALGRMQAIVRVDPVVLHEGVNQVFLVLRHEIGHAVGLGHVDSVTEVMNPTTQGLLDYGPGDVAGLRAIGCPKH